LQNNISARFSFLLSFLDILFLKLNPCVPSIVAVSVLLEGTRVPGKTDLPQTASHEKFDG
jgi:hypothetical protein